MAAKPLGEEKSSAPGRGTTPARIAVIAALAAAVIVLAIIFLGNGATAGLHADTYDFNDDIIPAGVSYWVRLVEGASGAA